MCPVLVPVTPRSSVAVTVTAYVPGAVKVWVGFWMVVVLLALLGSPKFQLQLAIDPSDYRPWR